MKMIKYGGIALKEKDFKEGRVIVFRDAPKAKYLWDCGVAISRFLMGLKEGRIIGRRCFRCSRVMVPPRMFCEVCFRGTDEWVELSDTGSVSTFSICYVTWDMIRIKEPQIPAVIEIDGASRGMGILHLISGVRPEEVHIGMKVRARWKREEERTGSIRDILHFEPI